MVKIELSRDLGLIANTSLYVSKIAEQYGVEKKRAQMLCFALETALEKRMQDLSRDNPSLLVEVKESNTELAVSITDKGIPYILSKNQKHMLRSGLVDRFRFEQLSAEGQRLSFFCNLPHTAAPEVPAAQQDGEQLLDRNVHCEPVLPRAEDVIEAIRCLWAVYRYEYVHSQLYRLDAFKKLLQDGAYISMLAKNDHGQTLGHMGLESLEGFPGLMEVCSAITKPFARGCGVAAKLIDAVSAVGETAAERGLFGRAVVFHGASQKLLNEKSFTPCGMAFNFTDSSVVKDDSFRLKSPRLHVAYSVKLHDKETEHRLYLPEECRAFVLNVFEREGLRYTLPASGEAGGEPSAVSYEILAENRSAEIKVDRIGPDLEHRLEALDDASLAMVLVYLNMNDPACPEAYRRLREKGYVFSGCFPGSSAGDYLLLQDLKGIGFLRDEIAAEPGYREMLDALYEIMDR